MGTTQTPAYGIAIIDTTAATGVLAIPETQGQPISAIALLSLPAGAAIEIVLGKGGSPIPISGRFSLEWTDCEDAMTGGIFYRVTTPAAGEAALFWSARSGGFSQV